MAQSLLILLFCLFVVMTGYGVTLPVLPFHIERMALAEGVSLEQASFHVGLITGIFALMQFFFAPIWGRLSDSIGRKRVLVIGMLGFAISNFLFGLSTSLPMLYASRFFGGSLSSAVLPVSAAFVADVTDESRRGRGMAWIGSAAGLGVMIGPALGGILAESDAGLILQRGPFRLDSFSIPFFTAGTIAVLAMFMVAGWLRSPPRPRHRQQKVSPAVQIFRELMARDAFRRLIFFSFAIQFAMSLFEGTFALHAEEVMGFGPTEMGFVLMVCGLVMAVGQGGVVSWFIDRVRGTGLLLAGFGLMGVSLMLLMLPRTLTGVLVLTAIFGLGMALLIPVLAAMVSRHGAGNTGEVMGLQNAANSLGQAAGPLVGGLLFPLSIHLPYVSAGILLLACSAMLARNGWNR